MVVVCLTVILALDSHTGPRAKALGPIWLPQCLYDIEAHLGHIITCMQYYLVRHFDIILTFDTIRRGLSIIYFKKSKVKFF